MGVGFEVAEDMAGEEWLVNSHILHVVQDDGTSMVLSFPKHCKNHDAGESVLRKSPRHVESMSNIFVNFAGTLSSDTDDDNSRYIWI